MVCVGVGGGVRWSVGCVVVSVGWHSVHGSVGVCAVCRYGACSVCVMVWLWCDVIMWCGLLLLLLGWCVLLTGGEHMGACAVCNRARLSWHIWLVGAVRGAQQQGVVVAAAITNGLRAWRPSRAPSHRHP